MYLQAAATQLHKLEEKAGKEVGGEIEAELGVKINESQICPFFIKGIWGRVQKRGKKRPNSCRALALAWEGGVSKCSKSVD